MTACDLSVTAASAHASARGESHLAALAELIRDHRAGGAMPLIARAPTRP